MVNLLFLIIFLVACSIPKKVNTKEFDLFRKEIFSNEKIYEIQTCFLRPSLEINFITSKDLKVSDMEKVIEKLKPVINVDHMDEIASKYWVKDSNVQTVYVNFYDGKIDDHDLTKNRKYKLSTNYYKTYVVSDDPSNLDLYDTWFIEIDLKRYKLDDYLKENHQS